MDISNNMEDMKLMRIIKDENSSSMEVEEAKERIFEKYEYMPKYMLKHLRLIYPPSHEEDLIHHGIYLIGTGIESYKIEKGCPLKSFLYHVLKKGILSQFFQKDKFRNNEISMTSVCEDNDFTTIDSLSKSSTELEAYEILMLEEEVDYIKKTITDSEYKCAMARYYGASYKETAKAFGYSVKQVDNKIQSIRKEKSKFLRISNGG